MQIDDRRAQAPRAGRRVVMAIVLTAGIVAAMTTFSGVSFAKNTHTPAHHQYKH
jgi:hypothetical protein